mgnify:CR=1 FL=1|tara:strand:- start:1053 stop:3425 length:2373 start_codon:yes stop_codon:yes gene_type:complete
MKLLLLTLILLISQNLFAQSSLEFFNSLPDEVKEQILADEENDFNPVEIQDSLYSETENDNNEEEQPKEKLEAFFGYSFFNKSSITNTPILDLPLQSDYIIGFNDELEILLSGNVNKLIKLRVDLSGNILIPEIGSISVLNLNLSEANAKIGNLVDETYISTKSNLSITKPSLKKISVIGSVKNPGTYLVNPFVSLSEAIKYADGLAENASIRNIRVLKQDGSSKSFDLYNFLIFGDRSTDTSLQNGDTVLIDATSNFVDIEGEILRPHTYEYLPTDSVNDLLAFSQGLKNSANSDSIFINTLVDNVIETFRVTKDELISDKKIESLNVGSIVSVAKKNVFVRGDSVSNGYFNYNEGDSLEGFLNNLSFSNKIYPFYFLLSQDLGKGLQTEYYNLSLADPVSYKDIKLAQNVNIEFFSKDQIFQLNELNDQANIIEENFSKNLSQNPFIEDLDLRSELNISNEEYSEWERLKNVLPADRISIVSVGEISLSLPLAGRITPQSIYEYLGLNIDVDISMVSVSTREKIELEAYTKPFNSYNVLSLTFPPKQNQTLKVKISGSITSPGTYIVPLKTSLDDLYDIAGGFVDGASFKGIVLARETIKELERKALKGAKRVIMDSIATQQSSAIALGNDANFDMSLFTNLVDESNVTGRVTGDFRPDSISASQTILQNGDEIFIPSAITTITVTGEVLNPITTGFEDNSTYEDYIEAAGGFTSFADRGSIYVIKSNGTSIRYSKGFFERNQYPEPGDTIVIPRDYNQLNGLPLVSVATKVISDIAFAAASLNSLSN